MTLTSKQLWHETYRRLLAFEAELPIAEETVDAVLDTLPLRLPAESYRAWFKRGQKMAKIIQFPKMNFRYLTEVQRLAADSRETEDALPEIALISRNQQFRLTVEILPDNRLKLTLEALGLASSSHANRLIGIAAADSKDQLISLIRLNADGEGMDDSLENTAAIRQALLRPVIGLIEQSNA
ncbi:MAG: hypothetical protein ABL903_13870 [Methylococcales bacterium]